ncbi:MAG: triose-phosphate isomerase [Candidatus Omnitrophica bacterium]|nr:triose-phosphate isomerase [Candidatus Omnitrophota bacterium]
MPRRLLIAGNWKMNKTATEAIQLAAEIKRELFDVDGLDILVCPPFTALVAVQDVLGSSIIELGGQNMHFEEKGAYTGEISGPMLKDAGCKYVILGHSERRHVFGELDEEINKKVKTAISDRLIPILCVGEKLEEREADRTSDVVRGQLEAGLIDIDLTDSAKLVIAYEPVWAIGTGKTATSQQAQEVHLFIRGLLNDRYGVDISQGIRILYGGSIKPANIEELIKEPDVDGGLIGGASLEAGSFCEIVKKSNTAPNI